MSIKTWITASGLALSLLAQPAVAGPPIYICEISQVLEQVFPLKADDPPIEKNAAHLSEGTSSSSWYMNLFRSSEDVKVDYIANLYVGQKFVIDRTTGLISGVLNSASYKDHKILNPGNNENPFVLLIEGYRGKGGIQFMYVQVDEYARDPAKPFKALGLGFGNDVLLGNCSEG